jgi:hypothetical protein
LDNFVVQNNVKRIGQRKILLNIPIPVYNELNDYFYDDEKTSESVNILLN